MDLAAGQHDLAVRYGRGDWDGGEARKIVSAEYIVVVSPNMTGLSGVLGLGDLRNAVWLFESSRVEHQDWAAKHGLDFHADRNRFYPDNSLVLSAVRAGHGYSVQSQALAQTDLATGALVSVYKERDTELGYYLLMRQGASRKAQDFARWMLGFLGQDQARRGDHF